MTDPLKVAVAGLGTVGAETVRVLLRHADLLTRRCGREIAVTAVSARSKGTDRGFDIAPYAWYDDPVAMAREADADVVIELIGGEDGVAKAVCEAAFEHGRHVVTANKALLAHHGTALARAAEAAGKSLNYEAAVAGGIPIVKAIREGLAGNTIERVYGILNGTCNYILTTMRETGRSFDDVLKDAQELGYAEADPAFDVDGVDAAHKLAILTSLAFGTEVDFGAVYSEGIRNITPLDIEYARDLGYRIKLLAVARRTEHGIEQRVHPTMVPLDTPIAHVEGVFNAVVAEGDFVDTTVYQGRGAGGGPTASAVVADIVDIARGSSVPVFAVPAADLADPQPADMDLHEGAYYVRLLVQDKPGVIADVTAVFRDESVSMESMIQRSQSADEGDPVSVVMTTHNTVEKSIRVALERIGDLETVVETPRMIRIGAL